MISFKTTVRPESVAVGVAAKTKDEALEAAVRLLCSNDSIADGELLLSEVRAREKLASTGIGEGVAVPHALCPAIGETSMCVLRLAEPIPFDAIDGEPVDLVFLMAGPTGDTAVHLRLLSKLARVLHDESFRTAARAAPDAAALADLILERD